MPGHLATRHRKISRRGCTRCGKDRRRNGVLVYHIPPRTRPFSCISQSGYVVRIATSPALPCSYHVVHTMYNSNVVILSRVLGAGSEALRRRQHILGNTSMQSFYQKHIEYSKQTLTASLSDAHHSCDNPNPSHQHHQSSLHENKKKLPLRRNGWAKVSLLANVHLPVLKRSIHTLNDATERDVVAMTMLLVLHHMAARSDRKKYRYDRQ